MKTPSTTAVGLVLALLTSLAAVSAHCDSLDGPVVTDARSAFATGEVARVLKWVAPEDEAVIRERFERLRAAESRAGESVGAGREFVTAYVEFVHTVKGLHEALDSPGRHRGATPPAHD